MTEKRTFPNRVDVYLKPKNDALFKGFVEANEISKSEAMNMIVKDYFARIPQEQKMQLLKCNLQKNIY
jgi:hypothetical protein